MKVIKQYYNPETTTTTIWFKEEWYEVFNMLPILVVSLKDGGWHGCYYPNMKYPEYTTDYERYKQFYVEV